MVVSEGDMEASQYLTEHDGFQHTHLTGSNFTYENIVYGRILSDKERNLKMLPKVNKKPITTELGNVTPVIVHPGNWSRSEIRHQAKKIVTAKLNNSGFNCIAAQVVVLPKDWKHTNKLKKDIILDENTATRAVEESIDAFDFTRYKKKDHQKIALRFFI